MRSSGKSSLAGPARVQHAKILPAIPTGTRTRPRVRFDTPELGTGVECRAVAKLSCLPTADGGAIGRSGDAACRLRRRLSRRDQAGEFRFVVVGHQEFDGLTRRNHFECLPDDSEHAVLRDLHLQSTLKSRFDVGIALGRRRRFRRSSRATRSSAVAAWSGTAASTTNSAIPMTKITRSCRRLLPMSPATRSAVASITACIAVSRPSSAASSCSFSTRTATSFSRYPDASEARLIAMSVVAACRGAM